MRVFKLDNVYSVICESRGTSYGFRHLSSLMKNGYEVCKSKACYYNRTWESFEFETVILSVIDKHFNGEELAKYRGIVKESAYGQASAGLAV